MTYLVAYEKYEHGTKRVYVEADSQHHAQIMAKNVSSHPEVEKVYIANAKRIK